MVNCMCVLWVSVNDCTYPVHLSSPAYPRPVTASTHQPSCENRTMTLTCQVSGTNASEMYRAITWMDTSGPLVSSSQYTVGGDQLVINDVTAIADVEVFRCSVEMFNGIAVTGVGHRVSSPGMYVCTVHI